MAADKIKYKTFTFTSVAITTQGTGGTYYRDNLDITYSGYTPTGISLRDQSIVADSVVPYIFSSTKTGLLSKVSQTINSIGMTIIYIKN